MLVAPRSGRWVPYGLDCRKLAKGAQVTKVTLEEAVAQMKKDPGHPVWARVGDMTIEVCAIDEQGPPNQLRTSSRS
jgi:hypothetical protein